MSRRQYNGGRQNQSGNNRGSGIGSAGNNGQNNGQNNGHRPIRVGLVDPSKYGSPSKNVVSIDYTTKDVAAYLQEQAARVDKVISDVLGREVPKTRVEVMSFNLSDNHEEQPFVPFIMTITTNILDNAVEYEELPSIFRPSHNDGVHINNAYYDMLFKKFMYDKDDEKCFGNPSWRKKMNIRMSYNDFKRVREILRPRLEFPENEKDDMDAARVIVFLDPLRVFKSMMYDTNKPRERYRAKIKEAHRIDSQNFWFRVERVVDKDKKYGDNINIIKEFLAKGNSGMI